MRRINKSGMSQLIKICPEKCLLIQITDRYGFKVIGKLEQNAEDEIMFVEYANRYISWSTFFGNTKSNIWNYLDDNIGEVKMNITDENEAVHRFLGEGKSYILNTLEFNEIVPVLGTGKYSLYISSDEY